MAIAAERPEYEPASQQGDVVLKPKKPFFGRKFSRRSAAILTGKAVVGGAAATLTLDLKQLAEEALTHTPKRSAVPNQEGYQVYPGWIGAGETVFMDSKSGPERFFRNAVMKDPILKAITISIFRDFSEMYRRSKRFDSLGTLEELAFRHTENAFSSINPRMSPGINLHSEMNQAAAISIALACSGWPSFNEFRDLEVKSDVIPDGTKPSLSFWKGKGRIARTILPQLMPHPEKHDLDDVEPSFDGEDGARHFTGAKATFMLLQSSIVQGTNLEKSMPAAVTLAADYSIGALKLPRTSEITASHLTEWSGILYELKKTQELENLPLLKSRDEISAGFFDEEVWKDLLINAIAVAVGIMSEGARLPHQRAAVYEKLKDPNLSGIRTRPLLQKLFPLFTPQGLNRTLVGSA